ncbi:MAG: hypothetical protein K0V04_06695 [Deltaproteobacteria bacterium]|nr:hypothetical protein [Deltaproteobacteria bacterium]
MIACGPSATPDDTPDGAGGGSTSTDAPGATGESVTATSSADESTGAVDDTGDTDGSGPPPGCACVQPQDDGSSCSDIAGVECQGAPLCDVVTVQCARANPDIYACRGDLAYDELALDCALQPLRDRTPGTVSIEADNSICGLEGCGSDETRIIILDDGIAVVIACTANPIAAKASSASVVNLAASKYFDGCLRLATPAERFACMLDGLAEPSALCQR